MRIIINTPSIKESRGGVANHFKGLKNFWNEDVSYNIIGDRNGIPGFVVLPFDLIKFSIKCFIKKPEIVVLNPSLGITALKRDALFIRIAKLFKINVLVIFHGWDKNVEKMIDTNSSWFIKNYRDVDKFLVLASEFKYKLQDWGIKNPIELTTTKVNDELLSNFKIGNKMYNQDILFLARIEENKGIFTAIEAYSIVKNKFPQIKLTVAGEGNALNKAKEFVKGKSISDVFFTGKISGKELISVFSENSIYILPTTHGEGMPTSILEAMAFGLAIITRPIGGVKDFFVTQKMGFLIESVSAQTFAETLINILSSQDRLCEMGIYNHHFAKEHFLASKVATSLEKEFIL